MKVEFYDSRVSLESVKPGLAVLIEDHLHMVVVSQEPGVQAPNGYRLCARFSDGIIYAYGNERLVRLVDMKVVPL